MTKPEEFEKFLSILAPEQIANLWLIPLDRGTKKPPLVSEPKNPDNKMEPFVALEKIRKGFNAFIYANTTNGLCFIDLDVEGGKFLLPEELQTAFPETLTQKTRNGGRQLIYLNKTGLGNKVLKYNGVNVGELRADWHYILVPGCYVPTDQDAIPGADGYYTIEKAKPVAVLEKIPDFIELTETAQKIDLEIKAELPENLENELGYPLDWVLEKDPKLSLLLSVLDPQGYPSRSEADMAAASKLWFWRYNENQIAGILKKFRPYEKTARNDYLATTISKVVGNKRYETKKKGGKKEKESKKELPPIPVEEIDPTPCSLEELLGVFKKWLYILEDYNITAPVCGFLANFMPGDPDVLGLVAPSGSNKTEIIRSFGESENQFVYPLSSITENTLMSGLERNQDTVPLLRGRPIVIKDLTTLLSKKEDVRSAIFAQFRELTDGYMKNEWGSGVKKEYTDIHSSIVFGSTSAIERYYSMYSNLGARLVFFRPLNDPTKAREQAEKNRPLLQQMRLELHSTMMRFVNTHINKMKEIEFKLPPLPEESKTRIGCACDFVAVARTHPHHDRKTGEVDEIPEPEFPTRVYNTIVRLAEIHAFINNRKPNGDDENFAHRIIFDNIPKERCAVLLIESENGDNVIGSMEAAEKMGLSTASSRYLLDELTALRLATRQVEDEEGESERDRRINWYKIDYGTSWYCKNYQPTIRTEGYIGIFNNKNLEQRNNKTLWSKLIVGRYFSKWAELEYLAQLEDFEKKQSILKDTKETKDKERCGICGGEFLRISTDEKLKRVWFGAGLGAVHKGCLEKKDSWGGEDIIGNKKQSWTCGVCDKPSSGKPIVAEPLGEVHEDCLEGDRIFLLIRIIVSLQENQGCRGEGAPKDMILSYAEKLGIKDAEGIIARLRERGDIIERKRGFFEVV